MQETDSGVNRHDRLRLTTGLSAPSTLDEVAEVVGRWAPPVAGAVYANLALFDSAVGQVRVVHGPSLASDIALRWSEFPVDAPTPLCTAILAGDAVLLGDLSAIEDEYPVLLDDTVSAGLQATASLPLETRDGVTLGAIGLAWSRPQAFDELQLSELGVITELIARAAERAASRPPQPSPAATSGLLAVHALQEALLARSFNPAPSLDVAAAYLPASDEPMGGDWYDVFPVGDATCLVVGDVAGHGIDAAAAMAELKHAVRAYASEDAAPATVVSRTNRLVHQLHPGLTATVTVATWRPRTRTLWRCNAGHPPILRCRPGEYDFLAPRDVNLLLGVDPDYRYHQEAVQLERDATLVLYSDGLVEQPPESIGRTMDRLLDFCRHRSLLEPQHLVNEMLLWRLREGSATDDICVMAVRLP